MRRDANHVQETMTAPEKRELAGFRQTMMAGVPHVSRRDVVRWSALIGGAVATAKFGPLVSAAPSGLSAEGGAAMFQDEPIQTDVEIAVPFNPFGQPVTLDPHRAANWGPFWVMFPNVWGGLMRYTETGQVALDLAESYTVSEDGLVYTFKIRPDARYASGNNVVAEDFVRSWRRALENSNPSPMVSFMRLVSGYEAYLSGESDELGFRAVDETTVEITLEVPINYFLSYLAAFVWSVVDPAVLESAGENGFVLADAGTGPWRFTEHEDGVQFVMEPNTNHYGGNSPSIVRIVWPIVAGEQADSTALNLYREDLAVSADVPLSLKASVESDPALAEELVRIEPYGSTRAIGMDFTKEPFNDVRVRRAIALAVDRERWSNEIWEGTFAPALSFSPPVLNVTAEYQAPEASNQDLDEARQLLEEAGFPNGEGLPEIVYYQGADEAPEEIERAAALLEMIQEAVGVAITHDVTRTNEQIQALASDNDGRQFDILWWWNVTETPHLISEVCRTDSPFMTGVFNWTADIEPIGDFDPGADARRFDELMAQADVERDNDARNELYRQGEELVLLNAVYIPLGHWVQYYVQKPWLRGTRQGPWTGRLPVWFNQDVVVVEH
ncbi:MAG: peptide ABC transporter substrate-binding protein [Chloroflexota bacterium]|nr:peptide ABC transporter substrate-binding protein [Chloroflexota bacterium]